MARQGPDISQFGRKANGRGIDVAERSAYNKCFSIRRAVRSKESLDLVVPSYRDAGMNERLRWLAVAP